MSGFPVDPATLPLPAGRHLPGVNARPADGLLAAVGALAPAVTRDADAAANPAWIYGLRLIGEGYFWEAHEVLEPVWRNAAPNRRERFLVQAVIHLANAALKHRLGRPRAAARLVRLAAECGDRAFGGISAPLMGLEREHLAAAGQQIVAGDARIVLPTTYAT